MLDSCSLLTSDQSAREKENLNVQVRIGTMALQSKSVYENLEAKIDFYRGFKKSMDRQRAHNPLYEEKDFFGASEAQADAQHHAVGPSSPPSSTGREDRKEASSHSRVTPVSAPATVAQKTDFELFIERVAVDVFEQKVENVLWHCMLVQVRAVL